MSCVEWYALELALRKCAALATFDAKLAKAMHSAGGNIF
jgi:hypothetical protein